MDKVEEAAWVEAWLSKRFSARAWATLRGGHPEEWLQSQGIDLETSRAARRNAMRGERRHTRATCFPRARPGGAPHG